MLKPLFIILLASVIGACASVDPQKSQEQALRAAIISVKYQSFPLTSGASFKWQKDHIRIYHDPRLDESQIDSLLKDSIEIELINKGYQYAPDAEETDFVIAYAAALKSSMDNNQIQKQFGLLPGFIEKNKTTQHYEKGTVIFDIIDPHSHRLIWRSAGQAMATVKHIPEYERKQRIDAFIQQLLQELPQVNQ